MLILTGPPAAGKNTVGPLLAHQRERCAVIDVDRVRAMAAQPHRAPWQGEEGRRQQVLGVRLTCQLARGFAEDGWEVVILDVISPATLAIYRHELTIHRPTVAQLLPTREECERRFRARGPVLTAEEFARLYREQAVLTGYDLRIDNTTLSADETAARLVGVF